VSRRQTPGPRECRHLVPAADLVIYRVVPSCCANFAVSILFANTGM
jgi:hypothetical protein